MGDLLVDLKAKWEQLTSASSTWFSHLEGKYSKGGDQDTKTAREYVGHKKFVLTNFDRQVQQKIQQADPQNTVEQRDVATVVKTYLDTTEAVHYDLTDRNKGDATAAQYAADVQEKREAVYEQAKSIYDLPLVIGTTLSAAQSHVSSSTTSKLGSANGGGATPVPAGSTPLSKSILDVSDQPLLLVLLNGLKSVGVVDAAVIVQTKALFDGNFDVQSQFTATDSIQNLFQSWEAVMEFVKQFDGLGDTPKAITSLLELHFGIETLYGQLSSLVSETDEDSLLSVY